MFGQKLGRLKSESRRLGVPLLCSLKNEAGVIAFTRDLNPFLELRETLAALQEQNASDTTLAPDAVVAYGVIGQWPSGEFQQRAGQSLSPGRLRL